MPIYEYCCADCETKFEKMRPMSKADAAIACPDCGGSDTSRGLSLFAAFSRGNGGDSHAVSGTGGGCANCGTHSCGSCGHHH
jgi:putative FmdB family regulatory protein